MRVWCLHVRWRWRVCAFVWVRVGVVVVGGGGVGFGPGVARHGRCASGSSSSGWVVRGGRWMMVGGGASGEGCQGGEARGVWAWRASAPGPLTHPPPTHAPTHPPTQYPPADAHSPSDVPPACPMPLPTPRRYFTSRLTHHTTQPAWSTPPPATSLRQCTAWGHRTHSAPASSPPQPFHPRTHTLVFLASHREAAHRSPVDTQHFSRIIHECYISHLYPWCVVCRHCCVASLAWLCPLALHVYSGWRRK